MKNIIEAKEKEFETEVEKRLKKKLIALLRDDGRGHKHAKFANRLKDFLLKIVDRNDDPEMTAAISWEDATIYVSSGFVTNDKNLFYQLSVLMRHELAHNLMCHQVRMMHKIIAKYGKEYYTHISMSNSMHQLLNIIEDFEISNKRYTDEDKITVQNLLIGGRIICGLVTEAHRVNWLDMTVEQMYDALEQEIDAIQQRILAKFDTLDLASSEFGQNKDFISREIVNNLNRYTDINHPTNFFGTLEAFVQNKALYHFAPYDKGNRITIAKYDSLPEVYQEIITDILNEFAEANGYTKQDLRDLVVAIAKSNPIMRFDIKNKKGKTIIELYTPEEKFLAIDCLKAIIPTLDAYNTWREKVKKTLSDPKYAGEIQRIYDEVNK